MQHLEDSSYFQTNKTSEKFEYMDDSIYYSDEQQFSEYFIDNFTNNHLIDVDSGNSEINAFISNENKENIFEESRDKSSELIFFSKDIKKNKINGLVGDFNQKNEIEANINFSDKKEILENNNNSTNFLGNKRIIEINNSKEFKIFHSGECFQNSINKIEEIIKKKKEMVIFNIKKKNKKQKNIFKRRDNSDKIRKKIKSRFFKALKNSVNIRIKSAGSDQFFKNLPQIFIGNISKNKNKDILNLSFKEIFSKNFYEDIKLPELDYKNLSNNKKVLKFLESNDEISEKSNFNTFKNMKFNEIFEEYLNSKEFEMEIAHLKMEKENDKYIYDYIIKAHNLIEFFSNCPNN